MNTCLCSHGRGRHNRDAAGRCTQACRAPLCGCGSFRPGLRAPAGEPGDAESAATGDAA